MRLERDLLAKNAELARQNRVWLERRSVLAFNVLGAPGAGKTALLEQTIRTLEGRPAVSVLEGDQATDRDAARIREAGARALQINTGRGCHLDAHDVGHALESLDPPEHSLVLIENVGNLVCPALFDLGERAKVVVMSVTEGDDKPLKYPHVFRAASLMVLNKIDLLPYVPFDASRCIEHARSIHPSLEVLRLSAATGEGLGAWCAWLRSAA